MGIVKVEPREEGTFGCGALWAIEPGQGWLDRLGSWALRGTQVRAYRSLEVNNDVSRGRSHNSSKIATGYRRVLLADHFDGSVVVSG